MSGALRVRVRRRCQRPGPSLWVGPTERTRGVEGNEYCIVTGTCLQPRPSIHPCLLVSPPVPHVTVRATLAPERARSATRARAHVGSAGARARMCVRTRVYTVCVRARVYRLVTGSAAKGDGTVCRQRWWGWCAVGGGGRRGGRPGVSLLAVGDAFLA